MRRHIVRRSTAGPSRPPPPRAGWGSGGGGGGGVSAPPAPEGVSLRWPDAAAYREAFYGRLVPSTAEHRSSMLQDIERGRPTEIDAMNGEIAARGARLGLPAPVNATLTRLIRARAVPHHAEGP